MPEGFYLRDNSQPVSFAVRYQVREIVKGECIRVVTANGQPVEAECVQFVISFADYQKIQFESRAYPDNSFYLRRRVRSPARVEHVAPVGIVGPVGYRKPGHRGFSIPVFLCKLGEGHQAPQQAFLSVCCYPDLVPVNVQGVCFIILALRQVFCFRNPYFRTDNNEVSCAVFILRSFESQSGKMCEVTDKVICSWGVGDRQVISPNKDITFQRYRLWYGQQVPDKCTVLNGILLCKNAYRKKCQKE